VAQQAIRVGAPAEMDARMKLGFFETYALIVIALAIVVVVAAQMVKREKKRGHIIPRAPGPPGEGNQMGEMIAGNTCPECFEHDFFYGPAGSISHRIYCGNPQCRAAFSVTNYGPGRVWANRAGHAPGHLYL
jgi:hypothetical protein